MGKLIAHSLVTANGYFKGPNEDISWSVDDEQDVAVFANEHFENEDIFILGRITYELMAAFWPTKEAITKYPKIAEGMNRAEKIVFSTKIKVIHWNNTRIIKDDPGNQVRNLDNQVKRLKQSTSKNLTVLGSGTIVNQLAQLRLIDEIQLIIHPVLIAGGTTFLNDIMGKTRLSLIKSQAFKSGIVSNYYKPVYE